MRKSSSTIWDLDGAVSHLKELAAKKEYSMAIIADMMSAKFNMNIGRNAVIGKLHRLGINVAGHKNVNAAKPRQERHREYKRRDKLVDLSRDYIQRSSGVQKYEGEAVMKEEPAVPVTIHELTECTCRWPLGEFAARPPYMYCGATPISGAPYCEEHMRKAIDPERMLRYMRRRQGR